MKATALTIVCVLFLGTISGCGGPAFQYLEDPASRSGSHPPQQTSTQTTEVQYITMPSSLDGFRGIKWWTKIETLTDMVSVYDSGEDKAFRRKGDKPTIGEATLTDIRYLFWRGQFYGVIIEAKGYVNWRNLLAATKAKYRLQQPNEYIEEYSMSAADEIAAETIVDIKYNEISEETSLLIASLILFNSKAYNNKQKAEKAAESDF